MGRSALSDAALFYLKDSMIRRLLALVLLLVVASATMEAQGRLGLRRTLQDAQTTGNGTAVNLQLAVSSTIYCEGTGTTSGGVITIEEARDVATAGTWSSLTTINASSITAGANIAVHLSGVYLAVRARISSTITGGGTITCELLAN